MKTEDVLLRIRMKGQESPLKDGDRVFIPSLNCEGIVAVADGQTLVVRYGAGCIATFPLSALTPID